jgi:hypothetical protein
MAKLNSFFGPYTDGRQNRVLMYRLSLNIGDGKFTKFTEYAAQFSGKITKFAPGPISLELDLLDQNPNSQSGPCMVSFNGIRDNAATYSVSGAELDITARLGGKSGTIAAEAWQGGTWLGGTFLQADLWLGP